MIRQADDVTVEPEASLEHWTIIRTMDRGELHFVGLKTGSQKARITSPVADFDLATMTGTTRSGRKYALIGQGEQGTQLVSKVVEIFSQRSADWQGVTFDQVEVVEPTDAATASPAMGRA